MNPEYIAQRLLEDGDEDVQDDTTDKQLPIPHDYVSLHTYAYSYRS